jgi:hypothetical protein
LLRWCRGRDSNPHGLLHTPLKRARLPITPPRHFNEKNYLFEAGGALEFAVFVAPFAVDVFPGAVPGAGIVSVIGAAVLPELGATTAFPTGAEKVLPFSGVASGVASVVAGTSGLLCKTDRPPVMPGIEINNAEIIKTAAAPIVNFDKTVAVPRGPKAELEMLLVNNAPASVFPGCSKTVATSTMHEIKKIV